jgi:N-acetylglucosamine-6-phosphate deacetylase
MDLLREGIKKDKSISMETMKKYLESMMNSGDTRLRDMIGTLMSARVPIIDVVKQVQNYINNPESIMSPDEGRFEASPHSEGPYFRKFNKGGIVSLKHLTRPLKV